MKRLLIILMLFILVGCGATVPKGILTKTIHIDSILLEPCALLDVTNITTADDAVRENIDLYGKYAICAKKQDNSIILLKQFSGKEGK